MKTSQRPLNVLIVLNDQHHAGAFGFAGHPVVQTPHFDRLAQQGMRFSSAITCSGLCLPSRTSLLSGSYVHGHGRYNNDTVTLSRSDFPSLAGHLAAAGYFCGTTGKNHLGNWPGHGFHDHHDMRRYADFLEGRGKRFAETGPSLDRYPSPSIFGSVSPVAEDESRTAYEAHCAIQFLRERPKDKPFFLWMNFDAPHGPYHLPRKYAELYDPRSIPLVPLPESGWDKLPPEQRAWARTRSYDKLPPQQLRQALAFYYGAITEVDHHWGRVMATLRAEQLLDNTLIIFLADHGDHAGDHRLVNKSFAYDSTLRIPLLVRVPGLARGRVCDEIVQNVDVFPTITELLGLTCPPQVQGRSFAPLLHPKRPGSYQPRAFSLSEELAYRTIRTKRHKLVYAPPHQRWGNHQPFTSQLFDLENDPGEWENLYSHPDYQTIKTELLETLLQATLASELPNTCWTQDITAQEHHTKYGPAYRTLRNRIRGFPPQELNRFQVKAYLKTQGNGPWAIGG